MLRFSQIFKKKKKKNRQSFQHKFQRFDRNLTDTAQINACEIDDLYSIFANQWIYINRQSCRWYSIVFNVGVMHTAHFANVPILLDCHRIKFSIAKHIAGTYAHDRAKTNRRDGKYNLLRVVVNFIKIHNRRCDFSRKFFLIYCFEEQSDNARFSSKNFSSRIYRNIYSSIRWVTSNFFFFFFCNDAFVILMTRQIRQIWTHYSSGSVHKKKFTKFDSFSYVETSWRMANLP